MSSTNIVDRCRRSYIYKRCREIRLRRDPILCKRTTERTLLLKSVHIQLHQLIDSEELLVEHSVPWEFAFLFDLSNLSLGDLSTPSIIPCRNVVSFSDGQPGKGSGVPYFYLTTLVDPTTSNACIERPDIFSYTPSEYSVGTCGKKDPENPSCSKITLRKDWPRGHNFQIFKLDIENLFLINWFGGPKPLTVDQYLNAEVNKHTSVM